MKHYAKVSILLLCTLLLWECLTSWPLLDEYAPYLSISSSHPDVYIPPLEFASMGISALIVIVCYLFLQEVTNQQLGVFDNVLFLLCACVMNAGNGLHIGCVISERNIDGLGLKVDSLSALIHFMHEYWSHNAMLFGFFGMLLLIQWKELSNLSETTRASNDEDKRRSPNTDKGSYLRKKLHNAPVPNGNSTDNISPDESAGQGGGYVYINILIQWILPVLTGVYLAVFATKTTTEIINTCFFTAILTQMFRTASYSRLFLQLYKAEVSVSGVLSKVAIVGLLALSLLYVF